MSSQTTVSGSDYLYFPDGCNFSISEDSMSTWIDMGITDGDVTAVFNWVKTEYQTGNKDKLNPRYKQMEINGTVTLLTQDPEKLEAFAGGLLTYATTTASPVTPEDTTFAEDSWADMIYYDLAPTDSSGNALIFSTTPVITSVTGSLDGAGGANDDYFIRADTRFTSGYGIAFNVNGTVFSGNGLAQDIVVDFGSNTPVATEIIYAGATIQTITPVAIRCQHTDGNSKTRTLIMYEATVDPGGFQFNFLGQGTDGVEKIEMSFTAQLDTTRTNGRQLMSWTTESGYGN